MYQWVRVKLLCPVLPQEFYICNFLPKIRSINIISNNGHDTILIANLSSINLTCIAIYFSKYYCQINMRVDVSYQKLIPIEDV